MNEVKRVILITVFSMIFLMVFIALDNGFNLNKTDQLIQPLIFTITFIASIFFHSTRRYLLGVSTILLCVMIFAYLFINLGISDWIGSLGFGIFFITIFTYLPEIISKGYIERY